ncbi:UNVERIFIED_CONTAM: hypothetical protein RMT77_010080 [Armadillidium vulgare]
MEIPNVMGMSTCEGSIVYGIGARRRRGKRMCQLFVNISRTLLIILFYYACSIGLTFYQKHLFKDFKFPLTVVVVHLLIKFLLSGLCREMYTIWTGLPRVSLPWSIYFTRLFPPGIAAGLDIGLSQWSLEFITVTLYTMSKSTALLFILFFAVLFKLEEMRWSVVILVGLIAGGLFMFTYKYTNFNLFGFVLVISASLLSGLRWTLSEIVMRKGELGLKNPVDMVYHIQPWMMISLTPLATLMEGELLAMSEKGFRYHSVAFASFLWIRILAGASLAFLMEVSEYLVVCYTSSLTLSIAGVAKEMVTLSLAVYYYKEHLTAVNQFGLVLCLLGIILHVILKASKQAPPSNKSAQNQSNGNQTMLSEIDIGLSTVPLLASAEEKDFEDNVNR